MQEFYVIVGREELYLYEKEGTEYNRQYIQGNSEFHYQINLAKNNVESLLRILADEYNLDNDSEMRFMLIENADTIVTEAVCKGFEEYLSKRCPLDVVMKNVIKRLESDGIPLIEESGVNYDGVNYKCGNGGMQKTDFNLLGYTLQPDDLMQCMV